MGHVKTILGQMKKTKSSEVHTNLLATHSPDLPGDHRIEEADNKMRAMLKQEYNVILKLHRSTVKKHRTSTDKTDRANLNKLISRYKGRLKELLTRIDVFTNEEKLHGFKEVKNAT
jgi:hypothetical protein